MLLGLVNNVALLLALGLLYDALTLRPRSAPLTLRQLISGVILGATGILLMLDAIEMTPGIIFDTRSILLAIAGLFFGTIPTVMAIAITGAFRLWQGGAGALMGVGVIVTTGAIGLAWRHWRRGRLETISMLELFGFGLVVHLDLLAWILTVPAPVRAHLYGQISLPVMVLYPLGTALLGRLMLSQLRSNQAEAALRESESRYRSLFENNHIPMLIVDPADGRIMDVNPKACAYYGWPRETMQTMYSADVNLLPPEEIKAEMQQAVSEHRNSFIFQHRLADGTVRDVEVHSGPIQIQGRKLLYSVINDITDRKRTEEALRESDGRFRNLVESAPIPIYIEAEGRFTYLNAAAVRAFGAKAGGELLGQPVMERFHKDFKSTVSHRMRQLHEQHQAVPVVEEACLKLDGSSFNAEVSAVPFSQEGRAGALVFFRDVTDRKRAEEQRMQMERQIQQTQKLESLGVLAGGIAHDFNNILMAVLGHADLALSELPPLSPARESIREIEQASRRAAELCRQMLAYSGRGKFVIETIHLRDLIEEMLHLLKTTLSKKVLLNLNLEKTLPPMRGDATQIRQVLLNLVLNASEAIGERSGVITISTGAMDCSHEYLAETYLDEELSEGLYLWLEVSDTGCGMDKETQGRLFEPFFTTKFTGRGLGMAAVLGIVRGHKGAMKVYSELGRGTTFKILFPAVEDAAGPASRKSDEAGRAWQGTGTVLLVDDEETIRALGKKMLTHLGFEPLIAADGLEALKIYRERQAQIGLVILDLTMPNMDGEETFRELRRINPAVRVVLSSGYTESEIISRFAGKGVAGFVQKPYTINTLRETLCAALEAKTGGQ
jgi:PAS domain S-box-containing protein